MASVHNAGASNNSGAEGRNQDEERPPDFSLCVHDVQFGGKVERKVKATGKRSYAGLDRGSAVGS